MRYRIWDKKLKKMFTPENMPNLEYVVARDGQVFDFVASTGYRLRRRDDCVAMLSTGDKDKDGKEIFDNDRVTHPYQFGDGKATVVFRSPSWVLIDSRAGSCDEILLSECTVTGNIYEQ